MRFLICLALLFPASAMADEVDFEEDMIVLEQCLANSESATACVGVSDRSCKARLSQTPSQVEMTACLSAEFRMWESFYRAEVLNLLNATRVFDGQADAIVTASSSVFKTIQDGEVAWQAYRLAHCASENVPYRYGTGYGALITLCHTQLTAQRMDWLRQHNVYNFG